MASFIEQLNAGQVHVVGHSRGADVALLLAMARPDLLRKLVLAEPAPINSMLREIRETREGMEEYRIIFSAALAALQHGDRDGALKQFVDAVNYPGAWEKVPGLQKYFGTTLSIKPAADADEPLCSDAGTVNGLSW
jgi:pimeloyl-ACP methyl ester carboxylesterase